jgi:50S ribosomal subunit-associated GTPase HflX
MLGSFPEAGLLADARRARDRLRRALQRREVVAHQRAHRREDRANVGHTGAHADHQPVLGGRSLRHRGSARVRLRQGAAAHAEAWKALVEGYLGERPNLKRVVLLIDARQEPQKTDGELIWGLRQAGLPFLVAATKYDKLTRSQRAPALATLRKGFGIKEHELVGVSSVTGEGLDALWAIIAPHVEAGRR